MEYHLVYILTGGDHRLPLVQSQTFEQAWYQAREAGIDKPVSCEVWIFLPFRSALNRTDHMILKSFQDRFNGVRIRAIFGINRLLDFPAGILFRYYRSKFGKLPVVFHCRGESAHRQLRRYLSTGRDRTVLDVRGYWPAEYLYRDGIEEPDESDASGTKVFTRLHNALMEEADSSDAMVTVSEPLAALVAKDLKGTKPINIIPCAVGKVVVNPDKPGLTTMLGVSKDKKIIVYSGGYARYQHLEDLTLPFISKVLRLLPSSHLLILSHERSKIKPLVVEAEIPTYRVSYLAVPQSEVSRILSGCDLGLLIRKPTLVNTLAQPVKVGEYLAAGVPICFHEGTSGVASLLTTQDAGIEIRLDGKDATHWNKEASRVVNYLERASEKKQHAIKLATRFFLWSVLIKNQRSLYAGLFTNLVG